jgi:putative hydrolase of the HAD superfamily
MDLRALLFDINGTLIDLQTDEGREDAFRALAQFLAYQGVLIGWRPLRDLDRILFDVIEHARAAIPDGALAA